MAAYFIVHALENLNPEAMKRYAANVEDTIKKHNGRFLVRSLDFEVVEGEYTPERIVLVEFDDMAALKGWYDGPAYAELKKTRLANTRSNAFMVEGV